MTKGKGWGKPGAAGLADGDYILQFVEFGNRDSQGPGFFEFEPREGQETPPPRVAFRDLVLDGPMKVGEVIAISQKWGGIDVEEGEVLFRCKGASPTAFIRWLVAHGMRFPSEDDPGDTTLAEPPDPNDPRSILVALETILQKRAEQGCLAQAKVGEFQAFGQTIQGRFIWDSAVAATEKLAKMFLEGQTTAPQTSSFESLRQEIFARVKTLAEAGVWSSDQAKEHIGKEYAVESTDEMNVGQLQDLKTYIDELSEEKGISLGAPF